MRPDPAPRVRPRPTSVPPRRGGPARPARPDRDLSPPLPAALSWTVLALFVVALASGLLVLDLTWWLPAWVLAASLVAFVAYGLDKSAARRGGARISEQTLLLLGLIGGWPGAVAAQQLFRHKTRKRSFRRAFWASVVVNLVVLAAAVVLLPASGIAGALPPDPGLPPVLSR
ncbi:DUF1294 domain-containing protein [Agromyces aurantiacus]|uniref:DUF1294 domain-containing protein n=1 Tax=Agromyces aurantiacus TaxID=165814 RepID=A0ABV9R5J3_9MICO|nr:DUF1294 domain-containing protein [Agromyces aurantiacus]MBM7503449.1 uncharacterized membrane protein YsdA (DUF1294 family) [Agromyces aurantiacus]